MPSRRPRNRLQGSPRRGPSRVSVERCRTDRRRGRGHGRLRTRGSPPRSPTLQSWRRSNVADGISLTGPRPAMPLEPPRPPPPNAAREPSRHRPTQSTTTSLHLLLSNTHFQSLLALLRIIATNKESLLMAGRDRNGPGGGPGPSLFSRADTSTTRQPGGNDGAFQESVRNE